MPAPGSSAPACGRSLQFRIDRGGEPGVGPPDLASLQRHPEMGRRMIPGLQEQQIIFDLGIICVLQRLAHRARERLFPHRLGGKHQTFPNRIYALPGVTPFQHKRWGKFKHRQRRLHLGKPDARHQRAGVTRE